MDAPQGNGRKNFWTSALPFLVGEFLVQSSAVDLPSGLLFPLGFFLFWMFFVVFLRIESFSDFVKFLGGAETREPLRIEQGPASSARAVPVVAQASSPALPPEIIAALAVLGLDGHPAWDEIHRRYRALAKRLHPDLNPDLTVYGNRFIEVDNAYRKLERARPRFFA